MCKRQLTKCLRLPLCHSETLYQDPFGCWTVCGFLSCISALVSRPEHQGDCTWLLPLKCSNNGYIPCLCSIMFLLSQHVSWRPPTWSASHSQPGVGHTGIVSLTLLGSRRLSCECSQRLQHNRIQEGFLLVSVYECRINRPAVLMSLEKSEFNC